MAKILVFGDSIAYGACDKDGGWVLRLRKFLDKNTPVEPETHFLVYNLGISGDNTSKLVERVEVECRAREPEIIIFAIGMNDSYYINSKDNPRVKLVDFQNNLDKLLKIAEQFTKNIIFVGLTKADESRTMPVAWDSQQYYDNDNINKYDSVIKKFCKENKLKYIPMFDLLDKTDLEDGSHPNSKGHQKMLEIVKDFLIENKIINI